MFTDKGEVVENRIWFACIYRRCHSYFPSPKLLLHFHECHYIVALLHITLIQDTDKWLEFYKSGLSLSPQWRHHCGVDCGGSMPLWCGGSMPAASCMFDRSQVTVTKLRSALFCPMFLFEWSSISMSYSIFIFTPLQQVCRCREGGWNLTGVGGIRFKAGTLSILRPASGSFNA